MAQAQADLFSADFPPVKRPYNMYYTENDFPRVAEIWAWDGRDAAIIAERHCMPSHRELHKIETVRASNRMRPHPRGCRCPACEYYKFAGS